jgi:hypothetical protein
LRFLRFHILARGPERGELAGEHREFRIAEHALENDLAALAGGRRTRCRVGVIEADADRPLPGPSARSRAITSGSSRTLICSFVTAAVERPDRDPDDAPELTDAMMADPQGSETKGMITALCYYT